MYTYKYKEFPGNNSNSWRLGGEAQGGNTDPCSFESFHSNTCSLIEILRFDRGSLGLWAILELEAIVEHPEFPEALILSAFASRSRHLRFNWLLTTLSDVSFRSPMQRSIALMVAAKASFVGFAEEKHDPVSLNNVSTNQ